MITDVETLREAREHVLASIAELKKAGHLVPIDLHHAARDLHYLVEGANTADSGNIIMLRR